MMVRCYSVFDRKALNYMPPFYAPTDGAAVRSLSDAVSDANSQLGRHPNDYVLYFVGEFDDSKGAMIPCSPLLHVIDAIALVKVLQAEAPLLDRLADHKLNGSNAQVEG